MNYSAEQQAIFAAFAAGAHGPQNLEGTGHIVISARAGTGKTTTIVKAFEHAPESKILYAVFNKRNQKEAMEKITDGRVEVKTLHSLGYSFIKRVWSNAKPDDAVEVDRIASALSGFPLLAQNREFVAGLTKLVSFLKNTTISPSRAEAYSVAESCDVLPGVPAEDEKMVCAALRVLELSKERDAQGRISFNDMVWLPVALELVRPWFDLAVIDEAQDMNLPQLMMARQSVKAGGRVVVVGDDRQAIYGFRGAVQDGMMMMKMTLRASEFSLTTTYRCPKSVVELAAQIVPDYHAAPEAPAGVVKSVGEDYMFMEGTRGTLARPGDAILSRLNAPLMPLALRFLRMNVPARIEGRDIGKQLLGILRGLKAISVPDLLKRIAAWEEKQVERIQPNSKNAEKKFEQVHDIASTLSAVAEGSTGMPQVISRLESLFQDTDSSNAGKSVVLSSVHKAKGLEWNRVFLLSSTFRSAKGGEEANIYYVALTRSKSELYLVGAGKTAPAEAAPQTPAESKPDGEPAAKPVEASNPTPLEASVPPPRRKAQELTVPAAKEVHGETFSNYDIPAGMIRRSVGDVIIWNKCEYVVILVGQGSATAKCLTRTSRTVVNRFTDETKTFESGSANIRVSTTCEPADVIRRMSAEEISLGKVQPKGIKQTTGNGENNSMKNNKSNAKKELATPTPEKPWLGYFSHLRKFIADGLDAEAACKKMSKLFIKMKNEGFAKDWQKLTGKKVVVTSAKPVKAVKEAAPAKAPAKKAAAAPAKPVAKPVKKAAVKTPYARPAAPAPVAAPAPTASVPPPPARPA